MSTLNNHPFYVFFLSLATLCTAVWLGGSLLRRYKRHENWVQEDFSLVQTTTLTLLGLIIGFTFSMALERYDQRIVLEEAEANAISTAYLRADLLPKTEAQEVRQLLKTYTTQRILFYTLDLDALHPVRIHTQTLQQTLWSKVAQAAVLQPDPTMALVVTSINDVLSTEGRSQGASWNQIPKPAWMLLAAIAICANLMIGFGARKFKGHQEILLILPVVISITFFLIADIDSPRSGVIRVVPHNLNTLLQSLP
jgi:hypothetical protein